METKLQQLTVDERIKLVEDLWDSIAVDQGALPRSAIGRSLPVVINRPRISCDSFHVLFFSARTPAREGHRTSCSRLTAEEATRS